VIMDKGLRSLFELHWPNAQAGAPIGRSLVSTSLEPGKPCCSGSCSSSCWAVCLVGLGAHRAATARRFLNRSILPSWSTHHDQFRLARLSRLQTPSLPLLPRRRTFRHG
jgi:hypothetical protein